MKALLFVLLSTGMKVWLERTREGTYPRHLVRRPVPRVDGRGLPSGFVPGTGPMLVLRAAVGRDEAFPAPQARKRWGSHA